MKRSIFILFILFFYSCEHVESSFSITGKVTGISDSTIFYLENSSSEIIDSTIVLNSYFELNGSLENIEQLTLYAEEKKTNQFIYTFLIMENEKVYINSDINDFPWNVTISGSKEQKIASDYYQLTHQKLVAIDKVKNSSIDQDKEAIQNKVKFITDSIQQLQVTYIKEHISSYLSLLNYRYHKKELSQEALHLLYNSLSDKLKKTKYADALKIELDYPAPEVGDDSYDFQSFDENGNSHLLSDIKGEYILIHFSARGCYWSRSSMKEQAEIQKKYGENLQILNFSMDKKRESWLKGIKKDDFSRLNRWDGKGDFSPTVIKYGVIGSPNFIILSPERKVVSRWFGYSSGVISKEIKKINGLKAIRL